MGRRPHLRHPLSSPQVRRMETGTLAGPDIAKNSIVATAVNLLGQRIGRTLHTTA